ncbi:hypothetical protein DL96DRAFT_1809056 [Flagelloscypha sp. PMI_526]|nr:hypothetical protein DL96DRAFT_1809056 [Flagelloscypha sp. PMI_526]
MLTDWNQLVSQAVNTLRGLNLDEVLRGCHHEAVQDAATTLVDLLDAVIGISVESYTLNLFPAFEFLIQEDNFHLLFQYRVIFHRFAAISLDSLESDSRSIYCWVDVLFAKLGDIVAHIVEDFAVQTIGGMFSKQTESISVEIAAKLPGSWPFVCETISSQHCSPALRRLSLRLCFLVYVLKPKMASLEPPWSLYNAKTMQNVETLTSTTLFEAIRQPNMNVIPGMPPPQTLSACQRIDAAMALALLASVDSSLKETRFLPSTLSDVMSLLHLVLPSHESLLSPGETITPSERILIDLSDFTLWIWSVCDDRRLDHTDVIPRLTILWFLWCPTRTPQGNSRLVALPILRSIGLVLNSLETSKPPHFLTLKSLGNMLEHLLLIFSSISTACHVEYGKCFLRLWLQLKSWPTRLNPICAHSLLECLDALESDLAPVDRTLIQLLSLLRREERKTSSDNLLDDPASRYVSMLDDGEISSVLINPIIIFSVSIIKNHKDRLLETTPTPSSAVKDSLCLLHLLLLLWDSGAKRFVLERTLAPFLKLVLKHARSSVAFIPALILVPIVFCEDFKEESYAGFESAMILEWINVSGNGTAKLTVAGSISNYMLSRPRMDQIQLLAVWGYLRDVLLAIVRCRFSEDILLALLVAPTVLQALVHLLKTSSHLKGTRALVSSPWTAQLRQELAILLQNPPRANTKYCVDHIRTLQERLAAANELIRLTSTSLPHSSGKSISQAQDQHSAQPADDPSHSTQMVAFHQHGRTYLVLVHL